MSSIQRTAIAAALAAVGVTAVNNCTLTNGTWPAMAWPPQHTRTEMMFEPYMGPIWSTKPIYYDWLNFAYRADVFFLSGESNPLTTLFNFSSYWINGTNGQPTLYMITYADSRSVLPTNCVALGLGFGMMRPDWMTNQGGCMGDIWVTSKTNGADQDYHRATWTRIDAEPGTDDGNFDWFADYKTGEGLMMQAPGPDASAYVVNEEFSLTATTFAKGDPTFIPPADIIKTCIPAGTALSAKHAMELVAATGVKSAVRGLQALPEVALAFRLAPKEVRAAAAAAGK